ncbi:c-type cytochrome [Thiomonas sp. FB-6]|uniref:c-type cytochrome n=1 Tax=Thiomonas sp. FB-6 TaxID=1158291 RepID=UPI0003779BE8
MSAHDSNHSKGHAAPADASTGALPFAPTLRKLIVILLVGFAAPVIILVLIAHFIASETEPPASSEAVGSQAATEQRIAPVAQASAAAPAAATATASASAPAAKAAAASAPAAGGTTVADAGKKVYESTCIACHGAGIAGAPKFGDKAEWGPIIAQGMPTLYDRALHGYTGKRGMMPPKGGSTASDADVKAAVDYMVAAAK